MTSIPVPEIVKEIGEIETVPYEIKQFEWRIPDFFAAADDQAHHRYFSPAFLVADASWYLSLWPNWRDQEEEFMDLFLRNDMEREYSVEYYFGLKKFDGYVEQLVSGVMEGRKTGSSAISLIKKAELLRQKFKLMPDNNLTIVCTLKLVTEISNFCQPTLENTKPQKLIRLDKLSENFKDLFGDNESCDVTLKVKDKEYKAHRSVLVARSSVFAATFKHDTLERQTGVVTISDCDSDSFQKFLEYLYSGKLEELSAHSALNLYYTSNKYDVEELKAFCVEYLMQSLTVETLCEIAVFASRYDETQLFKVVQDFFNQNFLQIFLTSEWKDLMVNNCYMSNKLLEEMAKMKLKE